VEDVKKEIHLHYEENTSKDGVTVKTLKDQGGEVRFMKVGFNPWEKVNEGD
jgi:hypothetical protein